LWLDDDRGTIGSKLPFNVSGGHTAHHQEYLIREDGETAFYGADNLPTAGYLRRPIAYKTDFDGKRARDKRKEWLEQGQAENWSMLLYHDMRTPVLHL